METPVLHYLYDPFCGWCYGAAPMITAAQEIPGLKISPHGVGMLAGSKAQMMSPAWRDFVRPHESRIHAFSKQEFGDAYVNGVQERENVWLDSSLPISAMLVAEKLDGRGAMLLKRLQSAYYVQGLAIADRDVIAELARAMGYDPTVFLEELETMLLTTVEDHIAASNAMLATLGVKGFPAFALEFKGAVHVLPMGHYFTRPALFKQDIDAIINAEAA